MELGYSIAWFLLPIGVFIFLAAEYHHESEEDTRE